METPPQIPAPPPPLLHPSGLTRTEVNLSMWCHLIPVLATVTGLGVLGFLGPLLIQQTNTIQSAFLERHSRESLNFQISMLIYYGVCAILTILIGVLTLGLGLILAIPVFGILIIGSFILGIIGTIKATNGEHFDYLLSIKFIK